MLAKSPNTPKRHQDEAIDAAISHFLDAGGSRSKASWASMLRPLKPLRMSVTPDAIQTFVLTGAPFVLALTVVALT
jgi:hypothetical protein